MRLYVYMFFLVLALPFEARAQEDKYDSIGIGNETRGLRGNTECKAELELAFAVSGIVGSLYTTEGQHVEREQFLMGLDLRVEQIELNRRDAIWRDKSELNSAVSKQAVAFLQWKSAKRLFDSGGSISREELQNRKLARDLADAEVERLQIQEEIEEYDRQGAEVALIQRELRAPLKGVISEILKKPGESAQAYEPVIALCDISEIIFTANFPAFGASNVAVGKPVVLHFFGKSETISGEIQFVSPVVDAASGLRKVKVKLGDAPDWMRPGLGAELALVDKALK